MRFNQQQFEDKVYALVTREMNAFFSGREPAQAEIVSAQKQILHSLHFVIEETITQIIYALLMMANTQQKDETK
jgi:hypothetical protein